MKEYRIIDYSIEYQQKLKDFLRLHNPSFSDTYIDFLVDNAWDENHEDPAILVVDEENNIVGEHLFFYTKAKINGTEKNVKWGHDTFLEESARKHIGLDFVIEINNRKDCFGIGLSEINQKITKKINRAVFYPVFSMLKFNFYILFDIPKRFLSKRTSVDVSFPNEFNVNGVSFEKVTDIGSLSIPNNGYWGDEKGYDIEFKRDETYLQKRFFQNPVFEYTVYRIVTDKGHGYFIVRPILYKGFKALSVVDYRYDVSRQGCLNTLTKAFSVLAEKTRCGILSVVTTEKAVYKKMKSSQWVKVRIGDMTFAKRYVNKDNYSVLATIADPDGEYHL